MAIPLSGSAQAVGENARASAKVLSVRALMWRRFTRNRLAVVGAVFLVLMYLSALFAGFLAPYQPQTTFDAYVSRPPQLPRFVDAEGRFHWQPFVYSTETTLDLETFEQVTQLDTSTRYPVRFFVEGAPYRLLGLIPANRHLFGVEEPGALFLLGTDPLGRDLYSRVLYGAQISLTVGLVGVIFTLVLGTFVGLLTGYYGGVLDSVAQRIIEVLLAFPQIPLWLALAALVPPTWSSIRVYFIISLVLSVVNWGSLARQVRGMVFALREEDFIRAATYSGAGPLRILGRHLFPNILSHVIVIATLAIPGMILGETALSFLGLGIKPPMISWGLLLSDAQHVRVLLQQPWLLLPAVYVVLTIISFNFVGDGLRDAADPFARAGA